jgi:hypothetical protein
VLDIIPSEQFKKKQGQTKKPVSNVVKTTWKLPVRLRRPINQEAARLKKEKGVRFERRAIATEIPSSKPPDWRKASAQKNVGVEWHTGDVYMKSRPSISLSVPPYAGKYAKQAVSSVGIVKESGLAKRGRYMKVVESKKKQIGTLGMRDVSVGVVAKKQKKQQGYRAHNASLVFNKKEKQLERKEPVYSSERDVPYAFSNKEKQNDSRSLNNEYGDVEKEVNDQEKINIPSGFFNYWFGLKHLVYAPVRIFDGLVGETKFTLRGKKPILNMAVLLIGFLCMYGVVWSLQGVGQGLSAMDSVKERAESAYERIVSAQAALAEADFEGSEDDFKYAETLLKEAQEEMQAAMSSSQAVLRYVDLTGTVRSGEELLVAAEEMTRAGQHISKGVSSLLEAQPSVKGEGGDSLIGAIGLARQEFTLVLKDLDNASKALDKVGSPFLPDDIKEKVDELKESVPRIEKVINMFLDQSEVFLTMLGAQQEQQYLILFENNHEIRPTGGFIGSIALVDIDKGAVEKIDVQSVYNPDGQLKDFIAPPDPLLPVTNRWYMRDANWFVDYPTSARKVSQFFEKEGGPTVDGVIAMTPEVIRGLLSVTGPVEVLGYGVTVDADNFWEVAQDQVSYSYDKQLNKPKQFMSDLTPLLLNKIFKVKAEESLMVLKVLTEMIEQKHLLMYFRDDDLQGRLREAKWSGELPRGRQGLLAVNNANIAGHKSDQFIEQEIDYRMELMKNGDVDVVATIRRTHNGPEEVSDYEYPIDENPATKDNIVYQRVLVPEGADLIDAQGFASESSIPRFVIAEPDINMSADPEVAEWQRAQVRHQSGTMVGKEAGHTFFANWMVTKPGETSVALYHYRLPSHVDMPSIVDPAELFQATIIKQPGEMRGSVRVSMSLPEEMRIVHTVPDDGVTRVSAQEIVYRGMLRKDVMVGMVFESSG